MKIRVPMMIQDQFVSDAKNLEKPFENVDIELNEMFLDGPVSSKVAVLDFNPDTNELLPGAKFIPPKPGRKLGGYEISEPFEVDDPNFIRVNVFATVLKTIEMFEEEDALGRPLNWAFDGPQLFVIPRAGQWENAYYERDSHSLQLFYFPSDRYPMIYTSLSRDIVAHETSHAILDGIAPNLYNAITPQSLALHEAIADLTALLMAFRSNKLREAVLDITKGSIENSTAFTSIAEGFGSALQGWRTYHPLRRLHNNKNLKPGDKDCVARDEPHDLSEVISGALYTAVMWKLHEQLKKEYSEGDLSENYSVSGKALAVGADRFKRMLFRALDYLPPGEVSFGDYGRAIIAADQASHPDDDQERNWIKEEFLKRNIIHKKELLDTETNTEYEPLEDLDLQTLVEDNDAANEFANNNRKELYIPDDVSFYLQPRLDVTKLYYHLTGPIKVRECIFKVSWDQSEKNELGTRYPEERRITVGTTLAIDWDTKRMRALLTSDHNKQGDEQGEQHEDRTKLVRRLLDKDLLKFGHHAIGPDGKRLSSVVWADTKEGYMRIGGVARMLHIVEGI